MGTWAGVPGFDSDALSPFTATGGAGASLGGTEADGAGDSLRGDSSLTSEGAIIFFNLSGETLSVEMSVGLAPDFRRSLSLAGVDVLDAGVGMAIA